MSRTAVIAGIGPGLGASLARKLVREGCRVGLFARSLEFSSNLAQELNQSQEQAASYSVDVTDPEQVAEGFQAVRKRFGPVDFLIYHAGSASWKCLLDIRPEEFEHGWRTCAYGGFLCARAAVPDMLKAGSGAILFTGATSSIRGRGGALAFSSAKFAVRGLADSLARELWPKGIHVAHIIIDGVIDTPQSGGDTSSPNEPMLNPDAIAETYWNVITQERSAWTLELDLRPFNEEFFV